MFIGYRKGNLHFAQGRIRLRILAVIGWLLGITFHVQGVPFGANNRTTDVMENPAMGWQTVPSGNSQKE